MAVSVIIPLMPIEPYARQHEYLLDNLREQKNIELELIVVKQEVDEHINKNALLNEGYKRATKQYVWHCDADFSLPWPFQLTWAVDQMDNNNLDTLFPVYVRKRQGEWKFKISDGGPLMKKEVLKRHGLLDDTIWGINYTTFPLMQWLIDNTRWECSPKFVIRLQEGDGETVKKMHRPSHDRLKYMGQKLNLWLKNQGYVNAPWTGDLRPEWFVDQ